MIIGKIINNNVISSWDQDGSEIIIMGRGLGFQKKTGQEVAEDGIEKIFRLESKDVRERFKDLLASMPVRIYSGFCGYHFLCQEEFEYQAEPECLSDAYRPYWFCD